MRRFAAPYDRVVGGITAAMLIVGVGFVAVFAGTAESLGVALAVAYVALLVVCWGWAPTGYSVGPGVLIVHRPFRDRTVALESETTVAPFDRPPGMEFRGWRVGGLWGIYGEYRVGGKHLYVAGRRVKPAIAVTTGADQTVVMPENPEAFTAAVTEASLPVR